MYLIGGGGYYRRTVEFTQPSSAVATAFGPFYRILFPIEIATTTRAGLLHPESRRHQRRRGRGHALSRRQARAESRHHYIFTSPVRTAYIPVTLGFRW